MCVFQTLAFKAAAAMIDAYMPRSPLSIFSNTGGNRASFGEPFATATLPSLLFVNDSLLLPIGNLANDWCIIARSLAAVVVAVVDDDDGAVNADDDDDEFDDDDD